MKELELTFIEKAKGYGFAEGDGVSLYIPQFETMDAMTGDKVLVHRFVPGEPGYTKGSEGMVLRILAHGNDEIVGRVALREGRLCVLPENEKLYAVVNVDSREIVRFGAGELVSVRITHYGARHETAGGYVHLLSGTITASFGQADTLDANYAAVLHEYRIPEKFPDEVLYDAAQAAGEPVVTDGVTDLRGVLTLTIDGADAKDLDDAISLSRDDDGNWLLGVHIADVSRYVREGSPTDLEAYERGTSVYFVDRVVPMLPPALSNGACSLNEHEDRYALSALMTLDGHGRMLSYDFKKSVIRSDVRGVYDEVNDLFVKGQGSAYARKYGEVLPMLTDMRALFIELKAAAAVRGQLDLESEEAVMTLDGDGEPADIAPAVRGEAEEMIEQFMLCANTAAASFLTERSLPCLYRVHENPPEDRIRAFAALASNLGLDVAGVSPGATPERLAKLMADARDKDVATAVSAVLLRSLAKARYSEKNLGHFGLALDCYCHFTSPIRRYPDLFVHRAITHVLTGSRLPMHPSETARLTSEAEIRATAAERKIESMYAAKWCAAHVGEEFDGYVASVVPFGVFVHTEKCFEGLVSVESLFPKGYEYTFREETQTLQSGKRYVYKLGMPLHVRIAAADPITGDVDFTLAGASALPDRTAKPSAAGADKRNPGRTAKPAGRDGGKASGRSFGARRGAGAPKGSFRGKNTKAPRGKGGKR